MRNAPFPIRRGFIPILTGFDLSRRRLPWLRAESNARGPLVWLAACAHGDEIGGIAVIHEIFRRIRTHTLTGGAVHAFPLMNPVGFDLCARHVPVSEEDLNRSFPGTLQGSLGERIAARIFETIIASKPALVLDLHNDWTRTIPYVVLDNLPEAGRSREVAEAEKYSLAAARLTGFPVVREPDPLSRTLTHSLLQRGIPALTIELGESRVVNERNVALGVRAIWTILSDLRIVESWPAREDELFIPPEVGDRLLRYSNRPLCSHSGIIRFQCEPGQLLSAGKPLARVEDAFGRPLETLRTASDGIVLGIADTSVAFPGAPVAALGLLPPTSHANDRTE